MFQGCTLDLQSPMAGVSVCLLFKAISIVYTSFHFCSPVRPVALWRPGHPFCPRLGRHRLRAPPSWPRSSTAGRSVSHPVPDGNVSLWSTPPGRQTEAWPPPQGQAAGSGSAPLPRSRGTAGRKQSCSDGERRLPSFLPSACLLVGTSCLPVSFQLVEL